ncbi:hypothetical protein PV326_002101, partial [Microctonus aethiopoides]
MEDFGFGSRLIVVVARASTRRVAQDRLHATGDFAVSTPEGFLVYAVAATAIAVDVLFSHKPSCLFYSSFVVLYLSFDKVSYDDNEPDILPQNVEGYPATKEFLMKVVDILLDYIKAENDRGTKVLEFHHPNDLMQLLDLELPDNGLTLQQLLLDCSTTLKYQVKT